MDELISEFLVEAGESLDVVDTELVRFETDPEDKATLNSVFRLVHTIKGTCGFLGLARLEAVAHAAETLLGRFRDGVLAVSPDAVTRVLEAIDRIKSILTAMAETGVEPAGDDSELIGALEAMAGGEAAAATAAAAEAEPEPEPAAVDPATLDPRYDPAQGRVLRPGEVSLADLEAAFNSVEADDPVAAPWTAPAAEAPAMEAPAAAAPVAPPPAKPVADDEAHGGDRQGQAIRVGVDVLEDMMTLVSELVLTRNQLLQLNRQLADGAFTAPLQRLSTITGELQDNVMKTRMQPIGAAWKKLPRLVRDLARELGKEIDLVLEGEGTELDRQVLELIRDPLTHMVRNSADHGLETPAVRRAAGKPAAGRIKLSALHEGGSIVIRVEDDGAGLNTAKIKAKALERGVISRAEADAMSDAAAHRLIFAPGFSTADKVTSVSGRGVGMDVVKTNIEEIGGQVDVVAHGGPGTLFVIKIPLTLAIMPALIVGVSGQRFALPQGAVLELVRAGDEAEHRIETLEGVKLLRLREKLIPLIDLGSTFGLPAVAAKVAFVVVMQVGPASFGVVVEDVFDTEEIVVKPLAAALREVQLFSGATILGDGSVVLIVEPNTLASMAGEAPAQASAEAAEARQWGDAAAEKTSLLIVRAGAGAEKVVELSRVTRLEHARADAIERANGGATLQYRGRLTPVIPLEGATLRCQGRQPLLVFTGEGYALALAVDEIIDVVEDRLVIELRSEEIGSLGAAVVAGRAVESIDVDHYLVRAIAEHARHGASFTAPAEEIAA